MIPNVAIFQVSNYSVFEVDLPTVGKKKVLLEILVFIGKKVFCGFYARLLITKLPRPFLQTIKKHLRRFRKIPSIFTIFCSIF